MIGTAFPINPLGGNPSGGGEKRMNKKLSILVSLLVVAMLAFPMSTVFAEEPIDVEGTFSATPGAVPVKFPGNNIIFEHSGVGAWEGDISGDTVAQHRWVAHANGITNVHVELTFSSVTVMGESKSGTLSMLFLGKITGLGIGEGTWRIIGGTGDLANLHGGGTWSPGQYEGQVHFDP